MNRILRIGHPLLLERSAEVREFGTPGLQRLVDEMLAIMEQHQGVGLAAPQIGILQRIIVFGMEECARYPECEPVPLTVLINPAFEPMEEDLEQEWEGCLSIPGMRGLVPRYRRIRYRGQDLQGRPISREASGFHARILQHELDHLDGVLYPQRIRDMRMFGYEEELALAPPQAGA